MPAAYPSTLPLALLDKTREQPASFQIAQPRRGKGYVEPTGTDVPVFWSLTWRFTEAQAQAFRQWFVYVINRGVDPFTMSIRTEFGIESHECQFLPEGLMPARQIGSDVWEYRATVMASEPSVPAVDQFFADVLLLANGAGLTVDSSSYARTLSSSGSIALSGTYPLNSTNTYAVSPGGQLTNGDSSSVASMLGSGEWCAEFWMRYVSASFGIEGNVNQWPVGIVSVNPSRLVRFVDSGLSLDIQSPTALTSGAFTHVAIIRDNTTHATYARFHIAINGTVAVTSSTTTAKSATAASSGVRVMGFDINSPTVAFGGYRLTRGTRRYLTNTEGAAVNTFTPDTYPFLLGTY